MLALPQSELLEEADIVVVEETEVVDAVADHRKTFDTKAEGEAGDGFGIVADVLEDGGIHNARAADFNPAGAFADAAARAAADHATGVGFDGRFGEGEVMRAETDFRLVTEHVASEGGENAFQIGQRDVFIDIQAFDLVEGHAMCRVRRVAAIAATGADDADRRLLRHHRTNLHVRRLRTQENRVLVEIVAFVKIEIELVFGGTRRMVHGGVQRVEIVPHGVDVGAVRDDETHAAEDGDCGVHDKEDGMLVADFRLASGQREVECVLLFLFLLELVGAVVESLLDGVFDGVERLADGGFFFRRDGSELGHQGGKGAFPADVFGADRFEGLFVVDGLDFRQGLVLNGEKLLFEFRHGDFRWL